MLSNLTMDFNALLKSVSASDLNTITQLLQGSGLGQAPAATTATTTPGGKKKTIKKVAKKKPVEEAKQQQQGSISNAKISDFESILSCVDVDKLKQTVVDLQMNQKPTNATHNAPKTDLKQLAKQNVVYTGFNDKLIEVIKKFAVKFPEDETKIETIRRAVEAKIAIDVTEPMNIWLKSTKNHSHCFKECTEENVKYFLENAKHIDILQPLEIEKRWSRFTPENIRVLWADMAELNLLSGVTDIVGAKLMNSIQRMTGMMRMKGQIGEQTLKLDKSTLTDVLAQAITSSPEVLQDMAELQAEIQEKQSTSIPLPPIMSSIVEKMSQQ